MYCPNWARWMISGSTLHWSYSPCMILCIVVLCWNELLVSQAEHWAGRQMRHFGIVWATVSRLPSAWTVHWELQICTNTLQISANVPIAMSSAILMQAYPMQWVAMTKRDQKWQMRFCHSVKTSLWMHWEVAVDLAQNILLLSGILSYLESIWPE